MWNLKSITRATVLAVAASMVAVAPVSAQTLIESYRAYIGWADLHNSKGARLTTPIQVLRQDRANVHRFGISQAGDEWDSLFGDYDMRSAMERWARNGAIGPQARYYLNNGGGPILVRVFKRNNGARFIRVTAP